MARNTVALTATGPGGEKDLRHLKTDSSGNLLVTGAVGGGGGDVQISDGVDTVTITDVAGKKSLDVNVTDLTVDHSNDSIRIGDGTNIVGTTNDGGTRGLNTHLTNESVPTTSFAFKTIIDEVSDSLSYIGKAAPGSGTGSAVWQIQRVTISGAQTLIEWADGEASFDKIWVNRAGLSYS